MKPTIINSYQGNKFAPFFTKIYPFSNHYKTYFTIDGTTYCCSEQYYMRMKAHIFYDFDSEERIMKATEASEIKRIGSNIMHFDHNQWRKISILIMVIANYEKFRQNPLLKKMLLETSGCILVEAKSRDLYWGAGVDLRTETLKDQSKWTGQNGLRRVLMRFRSKLISRIK